MKVLVTVYTNKTQAIYTFICIWIIIKWGWIQLDSMHANTMTTTHKDKDTQGQKHTKMKLKRNGVINID